MYAAHAEQKRKEASLQNLENCLALLETAQSDNDRFNALLEISHHVKANIFTDEDRRTILEATGLGFLVRLVKTSSLPEDCPSDLYKSMALSLLSALTFEPVVVNDPLMTEFLPILNDVFSQESIYRRNTNPNARVRYEQMCKDAEEVVSNMVRVASGIEHIINSGTLNSLPDYVISSYCQNFMMMFASLGSIVKSRGDIAFEDNPEMFHSLMAMAVDRLGQGTDLREKSDYAKSITSFLTGISLVEVPIETNWVKKLAQILKKLIPFKMGPNESEIILDLVCALVSAVGPEVLSPGVTRDSTLLKAVVARVSVEVYMMLDGIGLDNAAERYPKLDKVYKLLSHMVKFVAESGETLDSDSVIAVYKKLVETNDVMMEFLCSVANQEVELPRNHGVVLITVRTLAAMLTEITEDPTPKLLELLPFFNLLCQNVEYSDDVIMEVKNATQAALENIKMMGLNVIQEEAGDAATGSEAGAGKTEPKSSDSSKRDISGSRKTHTSSAASSGLTGSSVTDSEAVPNKLSAGNDMGTADDEPLFTSDTVRTLSDLSISVASVDGRDTPVNPISLSDYSKYNGSDQLPSATTRPPSSLSSSINTTDFYIDLQGNKQAKNENNNNSTEEIPQDHRHSNVSLSQECLDNFRAYQLTVTSSKSKPRPFSARKVTFSSKSKKKKSTEEEVLVDQSQHWRPMPDDVLGYLLPSYAFLLDSEEALQIMVRCDTFQTVVSFLEKSLSELLENKSSVCPENMTLNALSIIEQVYTNSPSTAAKLHCFQALFEISVLSVPNLLTLDHPPPLVCLKLVEVSLVAYRLQMRENKRNSSLLRLKHSQSRFFKATVEYLSSFYAFRQRKRRALTLHIKEEFRDLWPLAEESWCGCVAGLCTIVRSVEELQEVFTKSRMLPDFLAFLMEFDADPSLQNCPGEVKKVIESMLTLIESAAEGSTAVRDLVEQSHGQVIASKFNLQKLMRCLKTSSQHSRTKSGSD